MRKRVPKSIRVHIRKEKARIRAQISDAKEAEEKIRELVEECSAPFERMQNRLK